ncbi:MAG TPA: CerR family C-terminal domain-containing protein [Planctomycetota bacterium]|nr:CerR family C-terminal domain-containing protein [Planctomycetota bacterium]
MFGKTSGPRRRKKFEPRAGLPPKELPRDFSEEKRARLLEAAGAVFAAKGFERATVREICARAGANVAAVNYHFDGKASLYAATLLHAHRECNLKTPPDGGVPQSAPAAERLRGFIRAFLERLLSPDRPEWLARLMGREMVEPTGLIDELVRDGMRPMFELLKAIVRDLLPRGASEERVALSALSVVAQCVFYRHCAPVIRAMEKHGPPVPSIDRLADHIFAFSRAGLEHRGRGA